MASEAAELAWTNFDRNSVKRVTRRYNGLIGKEDERWHPTQKPLDLFQWIVEKYSDPGHIILDPFLGSGTTAVAARMLGRKYVGIELSEKYCEMARRRVASAPTPLFMAGNWRRDFPLLPLAAISLLPAILLFVLFTVLMEYRGGTYISQVRARSANEAVRRWAAKLDPLPIAEFSERRKRELIRSLDGDKPVPLDGLTNAWCTSALVGGSSALINIVATANNM